jgi:hypothetical protein
MTEGSDYRLGTTSIRLRRSRSGKETPLPSLELSMDFEYNGGNGDNGFNGVYIDTMAWSSPTTPLPTEANPRVVFERLFGDGGNPAEQLAEIRTNRSILDSVGDQIARLGREVGAADRTRVGEYVDSIRKLSGAYRRPRSSTPSRCPAT